MGLGPYTAPRAHEFTRLAVASGVKNPEQNVHVGDRRARGMKGMSVSRRSFEVSVRPAGVLEPRRGHTRDGIFAYPASLQGRTPAQGRGEGWCEKAMITCTYEQSEP